MLEKCENYITHLSADVVIAVHVPKPKLVDESLVVPTGIDLYVMYRNDINESANTGTFDREFTFQLELTHWKEKFERISGRFRTPIRLYRCDNYVEKDTIFVPETLEPKNQNPILSKVAEMPFVFNV